MLLSIEKEMEQLLMFKGNMSYRFFTSSIIVNIESDRIELQGTKQVLENIVKLILTRDSSI